MYIRKCANLIVVMLLPLWASLMTPAYGGCSVHNHLCTHHAIGVPRTSYNVDNDETRLVIYAKATDTSHGAEKTDFDNHVLLPRKIYEYDFLGSQIEDKSSPFIVSQTAYAKKHASGVPEWDIDSVGESDNRGAHVYAGQYQVIFNKSTAKAIHTGDLNGGEKGNSPYQSGCPSYENKANCEAVIITGNVPNGVYHQKVQMFNFYNKDNPKADLVVGAWATGNGTIINNSHLDGSVQKLKYQGAGELDKIVENGTSHVAQKTQLQGSQSATDVYSYAFYNRGFKPHAVGVTAWDHSYKYHDRGYGRSYDVTNHKTGKTHTIQNHLYQTSYQTSVVDWEGNKIVKPNYSAVRSDGIRLIPSKLVTSHTFDNELIATDINPLSGAGSTFEGYNISNGGVGNDFSHENQAGLGNLARPAASNNEYSILGVADSFAVHWLSLSKYTTKRYLLGNSEYTYDEAVQFHRNIILTKEMKTAVEIVNPLNRIKAISIINGSIKNVDNSFNNSNIRNNNNPRRTNVGKSRNQYTMNDARDAAKKLGYTTIRKDSQILFYSKKRNPKYLVKSNTEHSVGEMFKGFNDIKQALKAVKNGTSKHDGRTGTYDVNLKRINN